MTIAELKLNEYAYPYVKFRADVSSGTYIRSLVEDIGKHLATGAYMSDLRRTSVGEFKMEQALKIESLTVETIADKLVTIS